MTALRKPAKRLSDKLNKKRYLRLTVKLNNGKTVPKTIINPDGVKEDLVYATKSEQRGLKARGGAGKLTKHKIKSFYMEASSSGNWKDSSPSQSNTQSSASNRGTTGMQQGSNSYNSPSNQAARSGSQPSSNDRGTGGMQQGSNNFNSQSQGSQASQGGQGTQTAAREPQGNVEGRSDPTRSLSDPTRSEALAEGVRSLAEKALQGISTPTASGSPLNNPVNVNPFNNLRDAVTQRQAAAEIASTDDLTADAYKKSMAGVEDLRRSAYDRVNSTSVTAGGVAPSFAGVQNLGFTAPASPKELPRDDRALVGDTVAARLSSINKGDSELSAPPASSDITEDYRTGIPQDAIPMPRAKTDANLSFLQSRVAPGVETSFQNMSPSFVNSLSTAIRAAELQAGEKVAFKNDSAAYRDQAMQADIRARSVAEGFPAAPAGLSRHQYGAAVDIAAGPARDALAAMVSKGLAPGIERANVPDAPHFQESSKTYFSGKDPAAQNVSYSPASDVQQYASKSPTQVASKSYSPPSNFSTKAKTTPNSEMTASPANPAYNAAISAVSALSKLSVSDMMKKANEAASYVKQFANAHTGLKSIATGPIANAIVAKEATKAIQSAQLAISNFQKGTLTKVAAAKSLQKAIAATEKVQTAAVTPTMKATTVSTKPSTVVATKKFQDKLVAEAEPSLVSKIVNNIPAVRAVKKIAGVGSSIVKKLTRSDVYKDDQAKLAVMTPAQRVAELGRREGTGGDTRINSNSKKLTTAVLDKAAKEASTAVANSKYTSEGYLA